MSPSAHPHIPGSLPIPAQRRSGDAAQRRQCDTLPARRDDRRGHGDDWLPVTAPAPPAGARALLEQAQTCLRDARIATRATECYVFAHLAALRAATAVVVARSWRSRSRRSGSVWLQLTGVAPELREWAAHFTAGSLRRAAAEAGSPGVTPGEAETCLRHAAEFVDIVERSLSGAAR
ncbi:SAV_6107 family HEPN domain-containing protein [Saccharopolyspora gloriosae]|uniref:SAV_6107 family HEPN domain-containing protein n=1 Tax=Saccharopolyspora gloriosae TaxID=455344 RepID=UPI001FB7CCE6|nr:SAV_6107 family HEPN domain-containing protein [Saccharopolyspora gloriosae]